MAILTVNIPSVTLTVSGSTTKKTTISWNSPTLPNGAVINSSTLTGRDITTMTKGTVYMTINGTAWVDNSNFSISLGTTAVNSVNVLCTGNNKNAAGTIVL